MLLITLIEQCKTINLIINPYNVIICYRNVTGSQRYTIMSKYMILLPRYKYVNRQLCGDICMASRMWFLRFYRSKTFYERWTQPSFLANTHYTTHTTHLYDMFERVA